MNVEQNGTSVWLVGGEDVRLRIPIAKKLIEMGFDVAIAGSEASTPFDLEGIEYHQYSLKRGVAPVADQRSLRELISLFKEYRPAVVHAFDTKPALLVPKAAQKAGLKTVVRTVTGMGYVYSSRSPLALSLRIIYRYLQKKASAFADRTIFQNEDDMEYFLSSRLSTVQRSILVRGSGVDMDILENNIPGPKTLSTLCHELDLDGAVVITMVARMVRHKGVVEFLQAARETRKLIPNCRFLLIGPLATEGAQAVSKKLIKSYEDDVSWLGHRSDVPAILRLSDMFVLPSYYREGVPRVLLEAGALGLPLITTDMPGCRDVVRDGKEGALVPPRDAVALSKAIQRFACSPELRNQLGTNAQSRVRKDFSLSKVAAAYAQVYRELMQKPEATIKENVYV